MIGEAALHRAKAILEFGCGVRGFIELYRKPHQSGYALDIHDYSEHYGPEIKYLVSDGRTIALPNASIDLVVSHSVVEHIDDLRPCLDEMTRVTQPGGHIFITVSPLYFAPTGSHNRELPNWDHLNPASSFFMCRHPLLRAGASLNQRRLSDFAALFAEQPWDVLRLQRKMVNDPLPEFLRGSSHSEADLRTREFRLVARRLAIPGARS